MRASAFVTVVVLASSAQQALAVDDAAVRRCRDLADSGARLACYDAIPLVPSSPTRAPAAAPPAPPPAIPERGATAPTPTPAAQEARFGLPAPQVAELPAIESYIPGLFEGWRANTRIRLANGQVWQVVDDSSRMMRRQDPRVTVRRGAFGSFFLDFEGDNRSPQVRRVQ